MELLRSLHAVAGIVIALSGLIQIILPKGGMRHAMTGLTYLCAWLVTLVSGAFIGNPMITSFGIFGFYMALTGWRFASRRRSTHKTAEKVVVVVGALSALGTLAFGTYLLTIKDNFGWVGIFLGLIFTFFCFRDLIEYVFKKKIREIKSTKSQWYFEHISRMYISYIAAMTAFTVIQHIFQNDYMNWMVPSISGFILIPVSLRFFRKKLDEKK